jgi:thioredoxin-like negative regulator of GroEL
MEQITSLKKYSEVIKNKKNPILIELYTPWCSKCKKMEYTILESMPKCEMYKLNIDEEPFIDEKEFESISLLPCIWIYKEGKKIELENPTLDMIESIIR